MNTQEQEATTTGTSSVAAETDLAHADPPPDSPGGMRTIGISLGVALLVAIAYGLHLRSAGEKTLAITTEDAAVPSVNVTHPTAGSKDDDLALPGTVQSCTDTPIVSLSNGYRKKCDDYIGSRVHKAGLRAEIETP